MKSFNQTKWVELKYFRIIPR